METFGREKIGVVVKKAEDVVDAISDSFAHPQREGEIRRAMAQHVFHDPGRAAERIAGVVLHAAGLEKDLPTGVEVLTPTEALMANSTV